MTCLREATNLRGMRWCLVSNHKETRLVIDENGPKGVRIARDGEDGVVFCVGAIAVFASADGAHLFTVPRDEVDHKDEDLFDAWLTAGAPSRKAAK